MNSLETASPCIGVCTLDGELCQGCGRSLEEISAWPLADDGTKRAIVAAAAQRLAMIGARSEQQGRGA
jgi:predicted Fe-S protein YdhL (DUF1289 family)